jgi:hypothetical protein
MSVRLAKFGDIPPLKLLAKEMHARSKYAAVATMDDGALRNILHSSINAAGKRAACFVSVGDDDIPTGFLVAVTDRVFGIARELYASDVLFYVGISGRARDAGELLDTFLAWVDAHPGVIETRLGVHDASGDDWERVGALYERKGLVRNGAMYVKRRAEA